MRKTLLLLLLGAVLLLSGCTTEQTIVKKVNEPMALRPMEQARTVEAPFDGAMLLTIAPDHQTMLLYDHGQLQAVRNGVRTDLGVTINREDTALAASHITWSPNSRYACWRMPERTLLLDTDKQTAGWMEPVLTTCFNADQTTLFYTRAEGEGSVLYRRKGFDGEEERLLDVPYALRGGMYRTTRSQYLVMGGDKLLCLEQAEVGLNWTIRVVADFAPSGMADCRLYYSAQTGLCIVCGDTAYGSAVFSVVSPDGKDFVIDQVSCFQPQADVPAANYPADQLARLADDALHPIALRDVQLSPGGLYLLLWGQSKADDANVLYLLNLDTGKLTEAMVEAALSMESWRCITWCEGKTLLLEKQDGTTRALQLTGWDD